MSEQDIAQGTRWSTEIAEQLEASRVGVVCVTAENQMEPWLNFEAGALSKSISSSYVCPYLYEMTTSELQGPLTQFQAAPASREGTLRLLQSVNQALQEDGRGITGLDQVFDVWWPRLDALLKGTPSVPMDIKKRPPDEILEEVLANSREQLRREEIRLSHAVGRDREFSNWTEVMKQYLTGLEDLDERIRVFSGGGFTDMLSGLTADGAMVVPDGGREVDSAAIRRRMIESLAALLQMTEASIEGQKEMTDRLLGGASEDASKLTSAPDKGTP